MSERLPTSWAASGKGEKFFRALAKAPTAVLMLDYDGTLAPFHEDRLQANLYPGVRNRLERLANLAADMVVFISGRNAKELQTLMALSHPMEIWGSHGREHISKDGSYAIEPLTAEEGQVLQELVKAIDERYGQEVLEIKPNSVAVHWRKEAARRADLEATVRTFYEHTTGHESFNGILNLLPFDGGIEVRAGKGNKGDAARSILQASSQEALVAFLGDDATDEDVFSVLSSSVYHLRSCAVLVRQEPRASDATLWIRPPEEVLAFLDAWLDARENRLA